MPLIIIVILLMLPWSVNAYKFAGCDFESPYKCEVVHGIGLFAPPASWITVWFDSDRPD
jgi:hypothetical protein